MNKKIVSLLQYIFFLGLGIFLVWWSLRKIDAKDWADIKTALARARYWLVIPVVLALLVSHYSRAIRWRILMEPMGYFPKQSNTFLTVLIGYMANLAVPRLGEVLKCTILARYEKIPANKLVGTIVAERAFDVICLLSVMLITFLTQVDVIGGYLRDTLSKLFASKTRSLTPLKILLFVGAAVLIIAVIWYLLKRFSHIDFIRKIKVVIRGIWEGLTSVRNVKKKGWFLFHSAFIWLMYLVSVRIGMFALQETSGFGMTQSLSVLTSGSLAMIVPTPGGVGVYPWFVQETLSLYDLRESIGVAFGYILWTVQFFQMLLSGFVAIILLPYFNKKPRHAQT